MVIVWERKFLEHITACREAETVPIGKREYHLGIGVLCLSVVLLLHIRCSAENSQTKN